MYTVCRTLTRLWIDKLTQFKFDLIFKVHLYSNNEGYEFKYKNELKTYKQYRLVHEKFAKEHTTLEQRG